MRVAFLKPAQAEVDEAVAYFDEQREGLGGEFMEEISAVVDAIEEEPLRFPKTFRDLRRALCTRRSAGS